MERVLLNMMVFMLRQQLIFFRKLLSGSDDQHLILWNEGGQLLKDIPTAHTNNIFSSLFLPRNDQLVISAAGDGQILVCIVHLCTNVSCSNINKFILQLHDLETSSNARRDDPAQGPSEHLHQWDCESRVKRLAVANAQPNLAWSASEDGVLRQYDMRGPSKEVERCGKFRP